MSFVITLDDFQRLSETYNPVTAADLLYDPEIHRRTACWDGRNVEVVAAEGARVSGSPSTLDVQSVFRQLLHQQFGEQIILPPSWNNHVSAGVVRELIKAGWKNRQINMMDGHTRNSWVDFYEYSASALGFNRWETALLEAYKKAFREFQNSEENGFRHVRDFMTWLRESMNFEIHRRSENFKTRQLNDAHTKTIDKVFCRLKLKENQYRLASHAMLCRDTHDYVRSLLPTASDRPEFAKLDQVNLQLAYIQACSSSEISEHARLIAHSVFNRLTEVDQDTLAIALEDNTHLLFQEHLAARLLLEHYLPAIKSKSHDDELPRSEDFRVIALMGRTLLLQHLIICALRHAETSDLDIDCQLRDVRAELNNHEDLKTAISRASSALCLFPGLEAEHPELQVMGDFNYQLLIHRLHGSSTELRFSMEGLMHSQLQVLTGLKTARQLASEGKLSQYYVSLIAEQLQDLLQKCGAEFIQISQEPGMEPKEQTNLVVVAATFLLLASYLPDWMSMDPASMDPKTALAKLVKRLEVEAKAITAQFDSPQAGTPSQS